MCCKHNADSQSNNVVRHIGKVKPQQRWHLLGQQPITIWLTGLSGSGKSTLGYSMERLLVEEGRAVYVLDGDNLRHGLNSDIGFSQSDRCENIRRVAEVANLMNDAGLIVIAAFISPYQNDRKMAEEIIGADRFFEVHVATEQKVCEQRDPKGLYKRARTGEISDFTGISSPYEEPINPVCRIDTAVAKPDECARQVLNLVAGRFVWNEND